MVYYRINKPQTIKNLKSDVKNNNNNNSDAIGCHVRKMWIAEMQQYLFAVNLNVCDVVLEHCGNVDLWKLVLAEHNEQTGLPAGSVSDYDQLFPDRCHGCRHGAH